MSDSQRDKELKQNLLSAWGKEKHKMLDNLMKTTTIVERHTSVYL